MRTPRSISSIVMGHLPRFVIFLAAALFLLGIALPAAAQKTVADPKLASFAAWDDARLQTYIRNALKQGHFYNRAVGAARELVKRDLKSVPRQLMLGSACASRFASLGFALLQVNNYRWEQERHAEKQKAWEKAQENADPGAPTVQAPLLPLPLITPDDGQPFTLSNEQAHREMTALGRDAIAAWEKARDLSVAGTLEEKRQTEQVRGWGLYLLRRYGKDVVLDGPVSKNAEAGKKGSTAPGVYVAQSDIINSFEKTIELAPEDPQAWQGLALSLVPDRVLLTSSDENTAGPDDKRAVEAIDKALLLRPRDFDLLYQAAVLAAKTDPAQSVGFLNRALKRQGTNAVMWYFLAEQQFKQAEEDKTAKADDLHDTAMETVKQGNNAPQYQAVPFALPVPMYLRRAWQYTPLYSGKHDGQIVMWLGERMRRQIATSSDKGDMTAFVAQVPLLMNLSLRVMGTLDENTFVAADRQTRGELSGRMTMAEAYCYTAWGLVRDANKAKPSDILADLLEQYKLLRDQVNERQKGLREIFE